MPSKIGQGSVKQATEQFTAKSDTRAYVGLGLTLLVLGALCAFSILPGLPLAVRLVLAVIAAFVLTRTFALQHDCGHNSYFSSSVANKFWGQVLSPLTLTPFNSWRINHNRHHKGSGDLDGRDVSEVHTMTLNEYLESTPFARWSYRWYRSPFVLFVLGPFYIFFICYRYPVNSVKAGLTDLAVHNIAVAGIVAAVWYFGGWTSLAILCFIWFVASSLGIFIFYLQHNFENTYWERKPDLTFEEAALNGSSVLRFGWLFDLSTANIAYHDIHHLNPNVPSYNLKKCHRALEAELNSTSLGFREAIGCMKWKLWDENTKRMIPFPT